MGRESKPKATKKDKAIKAKEVKLKPAKKIVKSRKSRNTLLFYMFLLFIIWTATIGFFYKLAMKDAVSQAEVVTATQAKVAVEKDTLYYQWFVDQGNLYRTEVAQQSPETEETTSDTDTTNPTQRPSRLVLKPVTGADALAQSQNGWRRQYNVLTHVIHADAVDQLNEWESTGFKSLESGKAKVVSVRAALAGKEYIRVMLPVTTKVTCVGCDETDNVPDRKVTTAIILSYPMESAQKILSAYEQELLYRYGSLWLLGMIVFLFGGIHLYRHFGAWDKKEIQLTQRMEEQAQLLNIRTQEVLRFQYNQQAFIDHLDAAVYMRDRNNVFTMVNTRFASAMGCKPEVIIGTTGDQLLSPLLADYLYQHEQMAIGHSESVQTGDFDLPCEGPFIGTLFTTHGVYNQIDGVVGVLTRITQPQVNGGEVPNSNTVQSSAQFASPVAQVSEYEVPFAFAQSQYSEEPWVETAEQGGLHQHPAAFDDQNDLNIAQPVDQTSMHQVNLQPDIAVEPVKNDLNLVDSLAFSSEIVKDSSETAKDRIESAKEDLAFGNDYTKPAQEDFIIGRADEVVKEYPSVSSTEQKQDDIMSNNSFASDTSFALENSVEPAKNQLAFGGSNLTKDDFMLGGDTGAIKGEPVSAGDDFAKDSFTSIGHSGSPKDELAFGGINTAKDDFMLGGRTAPVEDEPAFGSSLGNFVSTTDSAKDDMLLGGKSGNTGKSSLKLFDLGGDKAAEQKAVDQVTVPASDKISDQYAHREPGSNSLHRFGMFATPESAEDIEADLEHQADRQNSEVIIGDRKSKAELNILLADDSEPERKVIAKMLEALGHTVTFADNGNKATEMYGWGTFDLIFMDIQMPVMNGIQAATQIRKIEKMEQNSVRIPIIAMSGGEGMTGDKETYISCGMDDFIVKPPTFDALADILDEVIEQFGFGQ